MARGKEQLDQAVKDISGVKGASEVLPVQADIANIDSVKKAASDVQARFGHVNIVVNNAGNPMRRMDRQILWPDTDWVDDMNLKIVGALRTTQAFLPLMPADGTGRVINISGTASLA